MAGGGRPCTPYVAFPSISYAPKIRLAALTPQKPVVPLQGSLGPQNKTFDPCLGPQPTEQCGRGRARGLRGRRMDSAPCLGWGRPLEVGTWRRRGRLSSG